jgi:peptidoglycan/xylan/chitin deacetylase (PgdA/CDA1 family)
VLPEPDPLFPTEIDVDQFDRILGWLGRWFHVMPLQEAAPRLGNGTLPPRAACLTFDDGYADNFTHALPALTRHGLHATFFIATGVLDGGRMWNDTVIEGIRATPHEEIDFSTIGLGRLPVRTIEDKRAALASLIPALKHRRPDARAEAVA